MIHKHNSQEHERIMNKAQDIKNAAQDLYINHHNGDKQLNKRIMSLQELSIKLINLLEAHVENTEELDDVYKNYHTWANIGKWVLAIVGTAVATAIGGYFMI